MLLQGFLTQMFAKKNALRTQQRDMTDQDKISSVPLGCDCPGMIYPSLNLSHIRNTYTWFQSLFDLMLLGVNVDILSISKQHKYWDLFCCNVHGRA